MADPRDEITKIIKKAESTAYERGWREALDFIVQHAHEFRRRGGLAITEEAAASITPRQRGRPRGKVIDIVSDCIASTPGMKGVDVVHAAQAVDATIRERTVRTCLRRLRENKIIWKRNGLWYPKPKQGTESTNVEVVSSSPH